jgi:hypothetical protein
MGNVYIQIHLLKYDYFLYEKTEIWYNKIAGVMKLYRSNEILLH